MCVCVCVCVCVFESVLWQQHTYLMFSPQYAVKDKLICKKREITAESNIFLMKLLKEKIIFSHPSLIS